MNSKTPKIQPLLTTCVLFSDLIENHENTRQLLDEDSVRVGLDLYPELYRYLGNGSLGDKNFLRKLPCDAFQSAVMDKDYIESLNQNVLIDITLLNQISHKNGSKTDFFTCIGPESGRKLFHNERLVGTLPGIYLFHELFSEITPEFGTVNAKPDFQTSSKTN